MPMLSNQAISAIGKLKPNVDLINTSAEIVSNILMKRLAHLITSLNILLM